MASAGVTPETSPGRRQTGKLSGAESIYLARLDRLLRTAERVRSLAERMESRCADTGPEVIGQRMTDMRSDAGELKVLADDLVLLGYTFREVQIEPALRALVTWVRQCEGTGVQAELRTTGNALQIDHRLLPVLRERLQELVLLLLDLQAAQTAAQGGALGTVKLHLDASVSGRSLMLTLGCDALELGAAELLRAARAGGLAPEPPETLLRSPGRLLFQTSFATGWGLPASWHARLLRLRDRLRCDRGDLQLRDGGAGRFTLSMSLPLVADLAAVLVVRCGGAAFGLPIEAVFSTRVVAPPEWRLESGQLWLDQAVPAPAEGFEHADWPSSGPVAAAGVTRLLGWQMAQAVLQRPAAPVPCLMLEDGDGMGALMVDEVLGERQVQLRHPRQLLRRARHLMGSFLLPSEEVCVVLHPWDLLQSLREGNGSVPVT